MTGHRSIQRAAQWLLLLSLSAGLVAGVLACRQELADYQYLRFGLYRTALRLLVPAMDRYALYAAGLLLAVLIAGWLGRRVKGWPGGVLQVALPLTMLGAAGWWVIRHHLPLAYSLKLALKTGLPIAGKFIIGPVGLGIVLMVLVVGLLKLRGIRPPKAKSPARGLRAAARITSRVFAGLLCLPALAFVGLHLTAGVFSLQTKAALRDGPNVIFIMVDTLRADHLGCYGYDVPVTPNIDRFAQEATRFAEPVAQASWTVWSVDSLFTSRFPDQLVSNGMGNRLGPGSDLHTYYPTLAKVLRDRGYATHAVISNPLLRRSPGNMMGYDSYDDGPANADPECDETSPRVNQAAMKLLDSLQGKRFFLSLVYMDPHSPYRHNTGFSYPPSRREPARQALLSGQNTPARMAERRQRLQAYDSEIGYTDHYVGQLLDELKQRKLYDDSLIVLFSDHGEEFLEHRDFEHMKTVYDEVIRVPLIVKLPRQRQGKVVQGRFPLIDLYPSLLTYLQIDARALGLQGDAVPLSGVLRSADKPVFSSTENINCVINGEYKYIETRPSVPQLMPVSPPPHPLVGGYLQKTHQHPPQPAKTHKGSSEVYHLAKDPLEQQNLFKRNLPPAADLPALLRARDRRQLPSDIALRTGSAGMDSPLLSPAERNRLKSLGYLAD
ncbi:MAG: sulfatase [Armatimonadota bacterium]